MEFCEEGDILTKVEDHQKRGTSFAEYELWSFLI